MGIEGGKETSIRALSRSSTRPSEPDPLTHTTQFVKPTGGTTEDKVTQK